MGFDPRSLSCPVCNRQVVADQQQRCPICETHLAPLVQWRTHASHLFARALEASKDQDWSTASILLDECRQFVPDFADAALLQGEVYIRLGRIDAAKRALEEARDLGIADERVALASQEVDAGKVPVPAAAKAPPRRLLFGSVAIATMIALVIGYILGRVMVPIPEQVEVLMTVVVTMTPLQIAEVSPTASAVAVSPTSLAQTPAPELTEEDSQSIMPTAVLPVSTAVPTLSPSPSPTPSPSPSPTSACPDLPDELKVAWQNLSAPELGAIQLEVEGCTVLLTGSAPTSFVLDQVARALRLPNSVELDALAVAITWEYTVQSGDNLWSIAERLYGDPLRWSDIYKLNQERLPDPRRIPSGFRLRLPESAPQREGEGS